MAPIKSTTVQQLYREGAEAVLTVGERLDEADWDRIACGHWTASETARHLLAVARWYHQWLDRALLGESNPPFQGSDIDDHNERQLSDLCGHSPVQALDEFAVTAHDYLERATEHWDVPFGYPFGTVTAGLHCGVAAAEWHLHAWDLSMVAGPSHTPQQPEALFLAAGLCVANAEGGVKGSVLRRLLPVGARLSPWESLLKRSGRTPER